MRFNDYMGPEMSKRANSQDTDANVRRIYLLRHGEAAYFDVEGNPLPSGLASLTEKGREQVRVVARALENVAFDRVVVSGLPRTVETARIVLGSRSLPLEIREEFQEIRRGDLALIADEDLHCSIVGAFRGDKDEGDTFLGGETFGGLLDRVVPGIEKLIAEPAWNTLLLVLHGAVNRAILSYALAGGKRSFFGHFEQSPACVNILDLNPALEGDWVVRATNLSFYDPVHLESRTTSMEKMLLRYLPSRRSSKKEP